MKGTRQRSLIVVVAVGMLFGLAGGLLSPVASQPSVCYEYECFRCIGRFCILNGMPGACSCAEFYNEEWNTGYCEEEGTCLTFA